MTPGPDMEHDPQLAALKLPPHWPDLPGMRGCAEDLA